MSRMDSFMNLSPESRVQSPESRVQSPESRVQSPESSPAFRLYAVRLLFFDCESESERFATPTLLRFGSLRSLADNILLANSIAVPKTQKEKSFPNRPETGNDQKLGLL